MQVLNKNEVQHVSGADFTMAIIGKCDSDGWATTFFSSIITGQISDGASFQQFIDFAQNNGANWDQIRIMDLEYSNFN